MADRVVVKDSRNMIIGYVSDMGDRKVATHFKKGYAGFYLKSTDQTFDKNGKIYSYGDSTQCLIRELERK